MVSVQLPGRGSHAHVLNENPTPEQEAGVRQAARVCPKQAIKLVD